MVSNSINKKICESADVLIKSGQLHQALELFDNAIKSNSDNAELLYRRGRLLWKMGNKKEAMCDYAAAVDLDQDSPAKMALEMARQVMDFYDRDRYNP